MVDPLSVLWLLAMLYKRGCKTYQDIQFSPSSLVYLAHPVVSSHHPLGHDLSTHSFYLFDLQNHPSMKVNIVILGSLLFKLDLYILEFPIRSSFFNAFLDKCCVILHHIEHCGPETHFCDDDDDDDDNGNNFL